MRVGVRVMLKRPTFAAAWRGAEVRGGDPQPALASH